jgi:hypothetical protein
MLAALFEGQDPQVLVVEAVARFRCISWDVLSTMPEIIVGGGPLDVVGEGKADLHKVSEPCRLGECTAFFSHSWHDDAQQKWDILSNWCEHFKSENTCSPRLWLDKVCIDQKDIKSDLQCLPIFLAGCKILLVLSGRTYTSRLWSCVELFVYVQMLVDDETDSNAPVVLTMGASEDEHARVREGWANFDAGQCECFDQNDKKRILAVVDEHPCGVEAFNSHVRLLATELFAASRASRAQSQSAPSAASSASSE